MKFFYPLAVVLIFLLTSCGWAKVVPASQGSDSSSPGFGDTSKEAYENSFQQRAVILRQQVAGPFVPAQFSDRGKYTFPKAIARFTQYGQEDKIANEYIREYESGYHFFHFPFVGLARILNQFPDAPKVEKNREDFLARILNPPPGDHYNARTGEGTENHIAMSRTSGYLFAQMASSIPALATTAIQWKAELKEWILRWSALLYVGGPGEWDSSVYTAYDVISWLNLYDFAEDPEVKNAARAVLDFYATAMALKYTDGVYGGGESRGTTAYGNDPRTATEFLGWLWFSEEEAVSDGFFKSGEYIQSVHAITSTYRPPLAVVALARKASGKPITFRNTKSSYLMTRPIESLEVFHAENDYSLGSVQTPFSGWTNAEYGVINWKFVLGHTNLKPQVIWGNGGMKSITHARGRNPFDQFLQYENVLIQMTRLPANTETTAAEMHTRVENWKVSFLRDFEARWNIRPDSVSVQDTARGSLAKAGFSYLFIPGSIKTVEHSGLVFGQYGETLFAIRSLSGESLHLESGKLIDQAEIDEVSGFVLEVGTTVAYSTQNEFIDAVLKQTSLVQIDPLSFRYKNLKGDTLEFNYETSGSWTVMDFDWGYGVREQRVFVNTKDWIQPDWPAGEGHGRMASLSVNGVSQNLKKDDQVYSGPGLSLSNSVLRIETEEGDFYAVDYTGIEPVFSSSEDQ